MSSVRNWDQATHQTTENLVRLVQTHTVNPPGNELPAIQVVKDILEKEGFPGDAIHIVESAPNRVNLLARLSGDGSARPFLMSGHVDVVPADQENWSHDPFGGEVSGEAVWGRGAIDMKGFLAMYLQTFLDLFRQKIPLKRDVILAAIADEEFGFIHGSNFLVEHHRQLIDAEYCINEGGALTIYIGNKRVYPIQAAEKAFCWLRARAHGKPGHGSLPQPDNPVFILAQALEKLHKTNHLPVHITPPFLYMVDETGKALGFPFTTLAKGLHSPSLITALLSALKGDSSSLLKAMVTNTVAPMLLRAGNTLNVIPTIAEADLVCRLVPGQSPYSIIHEIRNIVGEGIELETVYTTGGAVFPTDDPFYKLLVRKTQQMDPQGLVISMLMPGATDACQYQKAGIKVYGFTPGILLPDTPILQLVHGNDERMPISFIKSGLPVLWDVVTEFCG